MQLPVFPKKKLPLNDVERFASVRAVLSGANGLQDDRIAVKFRRRGIVNDVTYNEFNNRINVVGTALLTVKKGCARAAFVAENGYDHLCALMAVLASNGTAVPVDKDLPFDQILAILEKAECTTVFFDRSLLDRFTQSKLPRSVKNLVCFGLKPEEQTDGVRSFEALAALGEQLIAEDDRSYIDLENDPGRIALILIKRKFGEIFAVQFTESALCEGIVASLQLNDPGERCFSVLPFSQQFELVNGLLCSFACRAAVCLGEGSKNFTKNLKYYKPDYILIPPLYVESIWQKIVRNVEKQGRTETMDKIVKTSNAMRKVGIDRRKSFFPSIHEMFGGNLKTIFINCHIVAPEAVEFFDNVGIRVSACYRIGECVCPVAQGPEKGVDFTSAGVILPCVDVKIDRADEEGVGEICVRGDVLTVGYSGDEDENLRATELSGWFHTGDLGRISEKGQLYVTGSKDGRIVFKNGRSAFARDLEEKLLTVPSVTGAKVAPAKSQDGAELQLTAELVLEEGAAKEPDIIGTIKKAIDEINADLPAYSRIKIVHIKR